jgi:hypothetical protein
MKVKNQLKKLKKLLDAKTREQKIHREDMKRLLHKMKLKTKSLMEEAKIETDEEKLQRLKKKIDMLHAQRKKGVLALRKLDS